MRKNGSYHAEALEIVRVISLYKVLTVEQVVRLFPQKEPGVVTGILSMLNWSGRLDFDKNEGLVKVIPQAKPDFSVIKAFWVLLDFYDGVSFHTISDFPAVMSFFANNELYEVIVVPFDNETHINHAVWAAKTVDPIKSIVVVDIPSQIHRLKIPNAVGYCTVAEDGETKYFKVEKGVCHEQLSFDNGA